MAEQLNEEEREEAEQVARDRQQGYGTDEGVPR